MLYLVLSRRTKEVCKRGWRVRLKGVERDWIWIRRKRDNGYKSDSDLGEEGMSEDLRVEVSYYALLFLYAKAGWWN
jgi:hypothetical protein